MKKSNFMEGAVIATVGIVISRIIGVLFIIPFYNLIGVQGGALYSYAYSIYAIFLIMSSTGIPLAISRMVSEYNGLGYYNAKERVYKIGSAIIVLLGVVSFIIVFFVAPICSKIILGDMQGGNTVEEVTRVIRIISLALLIVPLLSVTRGYLQGHKIMTPSSISQVIEQLVRVFVILAGSYLTVKVFHLSIETAIGVAVFAATIGALVAYFYLAAKISKNKKTLNRHAEVKEEESRITNKDLLKKIIFYAIPFIVIELIKSAYALVDTMTVVRTLTDLGQTALYAETTIGVVSNWGTKLNMIVISIALGLTISLIPNIASSYIKKDYEDVNRKTNQSLQSLLLIVLPMVVGICILAGPVWVILYGYDALSIDIFRVFIFQALTFSFFTVLINILQTLNNTRISLTILVISFLAKAFLNTPFMYLCQNLGIPLYLGPILSTLVIQVIAVIVVLIVLKKKYNIKYKETNILALKIIFATFVMTSVLLLLNTVIPINVHGRLESLLISMVYGIVGFAVYGLVVWKLKVFGQVMGKNFVEKLVKKFKKA